jgi:hypothetical protein
VIEKYKEPIDKIILYYKNGRVLQLTGEDAATWQKLQNNLLHMLASMQKANDNIEPIKLNWEIIRDKYNDKSE